MSSIKLRFLNENTDYNKNRISPMINFGHLTVFTIIVLFSKPFYDFQCIYIYWYMPYICIYIQIRNNTCQYLNIRKIIC